MKTQNSNLTKANQAKLEKLLNSQIQANGTITTWKDLLFVRLAMGWKPVCEQVEDCTTRFKLQKTLDFKRKQWLPLGNECHPETIAFNALKDTLSKPILKNEYSLMKDDRFLSVPKMIHDYALTLTLQEQV